MHRSAPRPQTPTVRVEFLPEPNGLVGIARQIKTSARAYPLFGTARLFLEKPERHRVRITSLDPAKPLFHLVNGPVSFERAAVERDAFRLLKSDYYAEEVVQGDPIKGNYSNVARSRTTGALLGPTNYHGYQPALRKLYEERFSRRMSFSDFQQQEIEISTSEQAINDWKEQARSSTKFTTLKEPEPIVFKSIGEAEQHFRQQYLPELVKSGVTVETSGHGSRASADRAIYNVLREAWERERGFPASLVNHLRPHFVEAGLHFFKHRKRILYVSGIRPQRHPAGEVFSEGVAAILRAVEATPRITRPQLATQLLGEHHESAETAAKKSALASDLHYLIHAGHVIEFHDSTLDLPLSPKAVEAEAPAITEPTEHSAAPRRAGESGTEESASAKEVTASVSAPVTSEHPAEPAESVQPVAEQTSAPAELTS